MIRFPQPAVLHAKPTAVAASRAALFLVLVLGGLGAVGAWRHGVARRGSMTPSAATVAERRVSGETRQLLERFASVQPLSLADHLHAWRLRATATGQEAPTLVLAEMQPLFVSHRLAGAPSNSPPLLLRSPFGLVVRSMPPPPSRQAGMPFESHVDQFIAACAEIGVPLTQPVGTQAAGATLADLLQTSRKAFVLEQELEWSIVAFCLYLPDVPAWANRFGETHSYPEIAKVLLSRPLGEGSCAGAHKQYALALMLAAHRCHGFLPSDVHEAIRKHLRTSSQLLAMNQLPDGAWGRAWFRSPSEGVSVSANEGVESLVAATGHHLEWVAAVDTDLRPPSDVVARAARFVANALRFQGADESRHNICGFSHALRALCLLQPSSTPDTHHKDSRL